MFQYLIFNKVSFFVLCHFLNAGHNHLVKILSNLKPDNGKFNHILKFTIFSLQTIIFYTHMILSENAGLR